MTAIDEARYLRTQGCLAWEICIAVNRKPGALAKAIHRSGTDADRTGTDDDPSLETFFQTEHWAVTRDRRNANN